MKELKPKLRLIYFPFLLIAVGFVILYTLLNWLFLIQLGVSFLKEDIVHFWLPFTLPWIPVLVWLRPKINLLKFKNDNASFGYQFLASIAIAIPTIIAQEYLSTATGEITVLQQPQNYKDKGATKYYTLTTYYLDKSSVGIQYNATTGGKYNQDLHLRIYVALPILALQSDTSKGISQLWLGKRYSKTISNRLSDAEKQSNFDSFAEQCQREFDTTNFKRFQYLERLGNTEDRDQLRKAIGMSRTHSSKEPIVFIAHNEPFENRNGGKFGWIFKSFAIGAGLWFLLLLFPHLDGARLRKYQKGETMNSWDWRESFELFIPKNGFVITPVLINLNIFIYIIMVLAGLGVVSFSGSDLLNWGANFRPYTTNGQWWRLLSSIFLHGGLGHLIANMIGLMFVGLFLEPLLGHNKYTLLYLITGLAASCTSLWWHPATVSVGASGAIFGLYGAFLALLLCRVFPKETNRVFLLSTLFFLGLNLVMGLTGGIDNAAHIGGLVSGAIAGFILAPSLKRNLPQQKAKKGRTKRLMKRESEEYKTEE